MTTLLSVEDALRQILAQITVLSPEEVSLLESLGRVLAQDIRAGIDLPPFPNSGMDGYAVRADDISAATANSPIFLDVVMDIPAGFAPDGSIAKGQAARIMTGAPMPDGVDAVVPVENTDSVWNRADGGELTGTVGILTPVQRGANIRPIGENISKGEIVLRAGTVIRPAEIGVLASLGVAQVNVIRKPRVAVISTGDELVSIESALTPGKIRDSNSYTLIALLTECGAEALRFPIGRDSKEAVRALFHTAIGQTPDMIISSAGVSVGAADFVKDILEELGEVNFWRINVRPGKPLAFGQLAGIPFFGLPGNPVSVMVTFDILVRPALTKLGGKPDTVPVTEAFVAEDMKSDGRRSYIRVTLERKNGQLWASSTGTQSSGALMSMVLADGLLIIPEGVTEVKAGSTLSVRLLRSL